jgi:hypothetical protein
MTQFNTIQTSIRANVEYDVYPMRIQLTHQEMRWICRFECGISGDVNAGAPCEQSHAMQKTHSRTLYYALRPRLLAERSDMFPV